jgi:hypothetical protein
MTLFSYCTCGARNDQAHYSNCTANDPPAAPDNGWQPIETAPEKPMQVVFYSSRLILHDQDNNPVSPIFAPYRDEAFSLGFWDGESWCEMGTGHELFESWHRKDDMPTHWRPVPAAPTPPSVACVPSTNQEP